MANNKTAAAPQVDFSRLPRHVAIILDGNGRWAKKRGLPRTAGHAYGAEAFRRIGNYCKAIGIEYLTVYAFSTENWRRPPEEVRTIMNIFDKYMKEALSIMERDKFKMRFFGERTGLSPELQRLSNFLPWQGAYSELYFTDVLWPDFTERDMDAALAEFQRRDRRFGGVK